MNDLRFLSFILVLLVLNFYSTLGYDSNSSKIIGQWEWIRSSGGFAGEVTTRYSAGVPQRHLNFDSDYTFTYYRADTLVQTGKYSLKEKEEHTIISYDSEEDFFLDQRVTFKGKDTLILTDECYDCYINTYIRDH